VMSVSGSLESTDLATGRIVTLPRIGVVGPADLVENVLRLADEELIDTATLEAYAYEDERRAGRAVRRATRLCDVLLFTGPVPHDLARAEGLLTRPGLHVSLSGEALYRALLQVAIQDTATVTSASIDTLPVEAVRSVYRELGLSVDDLAVFPYLAPDPTQDTESVVAFHVRAARSGARIALTCRRSVQQRLAELDVPAVRVVPTRQAILSTVENAILLAGGALAREAQLAFCVVGVDRFDAVRRSATGQHQIREMAGDLQRVLLREARPIGATVLPLGMDMVVMITTLGTLLDGDEVRVPPIVDAVFAELGLSVSAGVGTGRRAQEAEEAAHRALAIAQERGGGRTIVHDAAGRVPNGTSHGVAELSKAEGDENSAQRDYRRLLAALDARASPSDSLRIVDAASAAEALGIAERSARRLLARVAAAGLVWPVSTSTPQRGRPRQRYRLAEPTTSMVAEA